MEVTMKKDEDGNIIYLKEDNKIFIMSFGGNLDLYWSFYDVDKNYYSKDVDFYITKENYFVYSLFEKLYEDISHCDLHRDYSFELLNAETLEDLKKIDIKRLDDKVSLKRLYRYNELYNNGIITWISDDRDYKDLDSVQIKKDEDKFIISFSRTKQKGDWFGSNPGPITIRFRNHGSFYAPFNCLFMELYNDLGKYDINDTQIHIEEYLYKVKKKKATH